MATLRLQQMRLIEAIDQATNGGCRRLMVQAPTGFGKTLVAATLAGRTWDARQRLIFRLAGRRGLRS